MSPKPPAVIEPRLFCASVSRWEKERSLSVGVQRKVKRTISLPGRCVGTRKCRWSMFKKNGRLKSGHVSQQFSSQTCCHSCWTGTWKWDVWECGSFPPLHFDLLGPKKEKKTQCQLVGKEPVDQRPACLACLPATFTLLLSNPKCTFELSNDSCCGSGSGATNEASQPTAAV